TEQGDGARLVDTLRLDPKHILVEGAKTADTMTNFGTFLLDVRNAERVKMQGDDVVGARGAFPDNTGVIRALDRRVGDTMIHEVRVDGRSSFFKVGETPVDIAALEPTWQPLQFLADNETLFVLTREG